MMAGSSRKSYLEWVKHSEDIDDVNMEQITKVTQLLLKNRPVWFIDCLNYSQDIHRTIPGEHVTTINSPLGQERLERVLRAYAAANPTVGSD